MVSFTRKTAPFILLWMVSFYTVIGQQGSGRTHYLLKKGDVVLFLGNSITQQAEPELAYLKKDILERYPELMQGEGRVEFILAGVGGEQAFEGRKRLPDLLQRYKPTVCVVNYGTCEITFENEKSFVPAMRSIIDQLRAANVSTTIVTNPPCSPKNWQLEESAIPRFLKRLPAMAKKFKKVARKESLIVVDAYNALHKHQKNSSEELTTDGIHLNGLGYRLMADALQRAWGYGLSPAEAHHE